MLTMGKNIYINEDVCKITTNLRKGLFQKGKKDKDDGKIFSYKVVYKKLYVKENEGRHWRPCFD